MELNTLRRYKYRINPGGIMGRNSRIQLWITLWITPIFTSDTQYRPKD